MKLTYYAEDLFTLFYNIVIDNNISIDYVEEIVCNNIYAVCANNDNLSESQKTYIKCILEKYKCILEKYTTLPFFYGFDYSNLLSNLTFKNIMNSNKILKHMVVNKCPDRGGYKIYCTVPLNKHDYYCDLFQSRLNPGNSIASTRKQFMIEFNVLAINPNTLLDVASEHEFVVDASVTHLADEYNNAVRRSAEITPHSIVTDTVILQNATTDTIAYFNKHKTGEIEYDKFLAKRLGYPVCGIENVSPFDKIVSSSTTTFWTTDALPIFELYKKTKCKIAVLVDAYDEFKPWISNFVDVSKTAGVAPGAIKVCYREKKADSEFNKWVKDNNLSGSVDSGDIYILNHKPPKWIFKNPDFINLIVTTRLFPSSMIITKHWFESHPCVIYLGDTKPTLPNTITLCKL